MFPRYKFDSGTMIVFTGCRGLGFPLGIFSRHDIGSLLIFLFPTAASGQQGGKDQGKKSRAFHQPFFLK